MTTSNLPSTAPPALVFGPSSDHDPRLVTRRTATLLDIAEPGEHFVCLTSEDSSGRIRPLLLAAESDASIGRAWGSGNPDKAGDPLEIEEVIDPSQWPGDLGEAGDPLEIEEVIDP